MKNQNGREHKGRRDLILISACVLLAVFLLAAQRLLQKTEAGLWCGRRDGSWVGIPFRRMRRSPCIQRKGITCWS